MSVSMDDQEASNVDPEMVQALALSLDLPLPDGFEASASAHGGRTASSPVVDGDGAGASEAATTEGGHRQASEGSELDSSSDAVVAREAGAVVSDASLTTPPSVGSAGPGMPSSARGGGATPTHRPEEGSAAPSATGPDAQLLAFLRDHAGGNAHPSWSSTARSGAEASTPLLPPSPPLSGQLGEDLPERLGAALSGDDSLSALLALDEDACVTGRRAVWDRLRPEGR